MTTAKTTQVQAYDNSEHTLPMSNTQLKFCPHWLVRLTDKLVADVQAISGQQFKDKHDVVKYMFACVCQSNSKDKAFDYDLNANKTVVQAQTDTSTDPMTKCRNAIKQWIADDKDMKITADELVKAIDTAPTDDIKKALFKEFAVKEYDKRYPQVEETKTVVQEAPSLGGFL